MLRELRFTAIGAACLAAASGCAPDRFPNSIPASTDAIDRVTADEDLSAQEKRRELELLGVPADVINALLSEEREGNQFGGDLRSAFDLIAAGRFSELTPDEVQIYADEAAETGTATSFDLDDSQAQAIVLLLREEGIDTQDQLSAFLDDMSTEVPATIPDGALRGIFLDFDADSLIDRLP